MSGTRPPQPRPPAGGVSDGDLPQPRPLSRDHAAHAAPERGECRPSTGPVCYVGIDDTDVAGSLGTKRLAGMVLQQLHPEFRGLLAVRHQLLFDPRVPYTSKNSAAALLFARGGWTLDDLAARVRAILQSHYVEGSDPGICVTDRVPEEVTAFGRRCQQDVVGQQAARGLAARHGIRLEGLGGTEDGVIGALAAVGLAASGDDGRIVQIGPGPDHLSGPQDGALLYARGVDEIRDAASGARIAGGLVDVGKRLRPNRRGGRVVLFVEPCPGIPAAAPWRAVRLT